MRVNIEDDLWTSGRLLKLARVMKWEEAKTLGHLALVYRATQKAGIIIDSQPRVLTVCVLHFESDEETERFLTAMVASQLASILEDGNMHIRGNEKHVKRLERLASKASDGGKASVAARQKKLNVSLTEGQPTANLQGTMTQPVGNAPYSLLLTPFSKDEETTKILDPATSKKTRKPRTPSAPSAAPDGFSNVVACWFEHYARRYRKQPKWGDRQGKQLKTLMATYTADELTHPEHGLIRYFFAWQRPEVIKAGHSFGKGHACFTMKIEELEADMAAPERRREAANATKLEQDADRNSQQQDQAARVVAQILGATNARIDHTGPARGPYDPHHAALRDVQAPAIGPGDEDVD